MTVRGSASALNAAVLRFAEAAAPDDIADDGGDSGAAQRLRSEIQMVDEQMQAGKFPARAMRVAALGDRLRASSRELDALAALTLIVTAHVSGQDFDRESFVGDARGLSGRLADAVGRIDAALTAVASHERRIRATLASAEQDLSIGAAAQMRDAADEDDGKAEAVAAAQRFNQRIASQMSAMVACMQHPDAFRQRAEHVDEIAERAETATPAAQAALRAVAAAQCEDMAEELARIADDAVAALADMKTGGADAARDLSARMAADRAAARLEARRAAVAAMAASLDKARAETATALDGLAEMDETLGHARALFESVAEERETLRVSTYNASIAANRLGDTTAGMAAVAGATRRAGDYCAATIEEMHQLMTAISAAAGAIDAAALKSAFTRAEEGVTADRALVDALLARAEAIHSSASACKTSLSNLVKAAGKAGDRLAALDAVVATTRAAGVSLREAAGGETLTIMGGADVDQALASTYDGYTMETERRVHEAAVRRLGLEMTAHTAAEPAPEEAEPDLASVLF